MQCQRLIKQIKSWYIHVSNETMAPARMVAFIEKHALECDICQDDPDLQEEIEKITELVLPESKIPKAVRMQQEQEEMAKQEAAAAAEAEDQDDGEEDDEDDEDEESTTEVDVDEFSEGLEH
jgi:hypothetical protein